MKHRILIEFESSEPLPADFTDIVLNRVYTLDCVDKKECTATLVGDVLENAKRYLFIRNVPYTPAIQKIMAFQQNALMDGAIDAAKDTK